MDIKKNKKRSEYIGGTDIAPILCRSKYRSPLDVYRAKAEEEETPDNLFFKVGRTLESVISELYSELTGTSGRVPETIFSEKFPFLGGSADWLTDSGRLVEFKTLGFFDSTWGEEETSQVPIDYYFQCNHYMYLYKKDSMDLLALERARLNYRLFTINYNSNYEKIVLPELVRFWKNHIEKKLPPEPTELSDLNYSYKDSGEYIEATEEIKDLSWTYKQLKETSKNLAEASDKLKLELCKYMKNHNTLVYKGEEIHTWKENKKGSRVFR